MTLKKDIEKDVQDNYSATEDYMAQINQSMIQALEDEKKKKRHEQLMDAVLSAWLALMFANFEEDLYNSAQIGIDVADKQLKSKGITTVADKTITKDTFENQLAARIENVQNDLITVAQRVKANSSSVFNSLNSAIDKKKREELAKQLLDFLKANGITHFYDKAGRAWQIENYIKMRTMTESVQAQRMAFFTRATQYGVDLVRIKHLGAGMHDPCRLCIPFEDKILSINGKTQGYMTIEEAAMNGLFHPNCDHIAEQLELAPTDKGGEGEIKLNEQNEKRFDYNTKKNFSMFEGS